jgi:hypothetical protein
MPPEELRFEEDVMTPHHSGASSDKKDGESDADGDDSHRGGSSAAGIDDGDDTERRAGEGGDDEDASDAFIFQENPDAFSFEGFNAPNDEEDDDAGHKSPGSPGTAKVPTSLPPLPTYRSVQAANMESPGAANLAPDDADTTGRASSPAVTAAQSAGDAATANNGNNDKSTAAEATKRANVPPEGYLSEFRCYEDARTALHMLQRPLLTRYALTVALLHKPYRLTPLRQPPLVL